MMVQSISIAQLPAFLGGTLAISLDGILYMVIIVFWVLANIASAKKKRGMPPPDDTGETPPDMTGRTGRPIDDELREMIETLTGQRQERLPPPPPLQQETPAPPPIPRQAQPPRQKPPRPKRERPFHPADFTSAPPPVPVGASYRERLQTQAEAHPADALVMPTDSAAASVQTAMTMTIRTVSNRMKSMTLPSIRQGITGSQQLQHVVPLIKPADLHDAAKLRKAVLYQTILGPPKALESAANRL